MTQESLMDNLSDILFYSISINIHTFTFKRDDLDSDWYQTEEYDLLFAIVAMIDFQGWLSLGRN